MGKVAIVVGKTKKKSLKKKVSAAKPSKFISQALNNKKKTKGKKKKRPKTRGLVYVRNLPHGFFEKQLKDYFSQFGDITRLRLGRSPKTLNSRGYAFIEFRYPEVAEIAAQTMNNYIMFHRIVKAKFIPPSEIKHDYFRTSLLTIRKDGEKILTSKSILAKEAVVENINRLMTDKDQKNRINKVRSRVNKKKAQLESLGIEFDIDMVAKNMSEEVIKPIKKVERLTIDNLNEEDLDDENDETFDPSQFDLDSGDEFQDFQYDSQDSETDEESEPIKKQKAVEVAKKVSTEKQKEKEEANIAEKNQKGVKGKKKNQPAEKSDEKLKAGKKIPQNKKTVAKSGKNIKADNKKQPAEKPDNKLKATKKNEVKKKPIKLENPAKKVKEPKLKKEPQIVDKPAAKPRAASKKVEQTPPAEKIVKKLREEKVQKVDSLVLSRKKIPAGKKPAKLSLTKEKNSKESPKLKKVSKASIAIKKSK